MSLNGKDWLTANGQFLFGKHSGDYLEDVVKEDPSYLRWILDEVDDINDEDEVAIITALKFAGRGSSH